MAFFTRRAKWPTISIDEIRKRTRVLVIDDSDFYYLPLFQKDGYTIEKWEDVEDLQKLESGYYDIVLLDIQGVGGAQSQEQGLGILRHLRKVSPAQVIIAYSNADFSLKYKQFFDMADAVLEKTRDYVDFKRTVDELLKQRFSLGFYVERVVKLGAPFVNDPAKLRAAAEKSILTRDSKPLEKLLTTTRADRDTINMALQVAEVAISILGLL